MKCNIDYLQDNGGIEYWCTAHKTKATANGSQNPTNCDCKYKYKYENIVEMNKEDIKSIKIVYPNLNENTDVFVFINGQRFDGILKLKNSIIDLKDYGV